MDFRLENRHEQLVKAHMQAGNILAPGVKALLSKDTAFNQTQAAWRFFNNENCTFEALSKPLLQAAHELSEQECNQYILIPHDWSYLSYLGHTSKKDTYNTIKKGIGYDLQTSLMISDRHGGPLSIAAMNLKTKSDTYSTYENNLQGLTHLEELSKRVAWIESQGFKKPLIHIIDREADSIAFLREMVDRNWLIRCNGSNYATVGCSKRKIEEIAKELSYVESRTVEYKGKSATQQIAETEVTITRAARPKRKGANGKRLPSVKGFPVKARLIVSRVMDDNSKELAIWYLLSNITAVSAATLALWYYWRWSIEICQTYCLHKTQVKVNSLSLPANDRSIAWVGFLKPAIA
jgi:hypothetical protein